MKLLVKILFLCAFGAFSAATPLHHHLQALTEGVLNSTSAREGYKLSIPPDTVDSLQIDSFLGRWFQMYASLIPNITFESDGFCVTADYFDAEESGGAAKYSLINSQRLESPTGELSQAQGTAVNKNFEDDPGKFRVNIEREGFYWIVALGEIVDDLYQWAVVSVPFQLQLFILARDVDKFRSDYDDDVLQLVDELGFTLFFNKPLPTFQSSDECEYAPVPASPAAANY